MVMRAPPQQVYHGTTAIGCVRRFLSEARSHQPSAWNDSGVPLMRSYLKSGLLTRDFTLRVYISAGGPLRSDSSA